MKKISLYLVLFIVSVGCSSQQQQLVSPAFTPGPPTYVYKTTADFSDKVPVGLSENGQTIVSFPHPGDLLKGEVLALPTQLAKGYWLDNRGIAPNTAFIDMTYEQYSKLPTPPSVDSLMKMVIDPHPFKVLYNCGNRNTFENAAQQINALITNRQLKKRCKKIDIR